MLKESEGSPMDRRRFAMSLAGAAGLGAMLPTALPLHGIHLHGEVEGLRIIDDRTDDLPGGGRRHSVSMSLDLPGRYSGETTMLHDSWIREDGSGRVDAFYWTASPAIDSVFGTTIREFRTRMTTDFGPALDEEYREVTIRFETSSPGVESVSEAYRARQRFELREPDANAIEAARRAITRGEPVALALSTHVPELLNTIDLVRIQV